MTKKKKTKLIQFAINCVKMLNGYWYLDRSQLLEIFQTVNISNIKHR